MDDGIRQLKQAEAEARMSDLAAIADGTLDPKSLSLADHCTSWIKSKIEFREVHCTPWKPGAQSDAEHS